MPLYEYECNSCGHRSEEFQTMREDAYTTCPVCSEECFNRMVNAPRAMIREYHKPIMMESMGLAHLDEIHEFKKRNPGVDCSEDPNDPAYGVPVAKSRSQKLSILKNEGWEEKN